LNTEGGTLSDFDVYVFYSMYSIMGVGVFTNPKVPEEVLSFKGPMIHSGKWDPSIDLENKVVAIVGSGPSAVQIIPEILPKVKKLISFQRYLVQSLQKVTIPYTAVSLLKLCCVSGIQHGSHLSLFSRYRLQLEH
jgi:lysine/ornithine N-monooxygenase